MIAVIAVQIAVPLIALMLPPPQKFGFQMYSGLGGVTVSVVDDQGDVHELDHFQKIVGKVRPDIDWLPTLPEAVCVAVTDAVEVRSNSLARAERPMRLTEIRTDPRPIAIARIGLGIATILNSIEAYQILSGVASAAHRSSRRNSRTDALSTRPRRRCRRYSGRRGHNRVEDRVGGVRVGGSKSDVPFLGPADLQQSSPACYAADGIPDLRESRDRLVVRPVPGRPSVVWWPQLLMMTQLSVCYLFSALSKVNAVFLSGVPLSTWVWIDLPWQFYTVAAVSTVAVELVIAFGLWFRSSRRSPSYSGSDCTSRSLC